MSSGRPLREQVVREVGRPIEAGGRTVMEGEDFSALNAMLARLREVRPAATAATPAAGPPPKPPGK